ncbi:MAG: LytR C-terminal domain-containing protein [Candidatus Shapirobacteria bacterium]
MKLKINSFSVAHLMGTNWYLGVVIFLVGNYYLYNKFFTKKTEIKKEVVVEIVPSVIPTIVVERKIEELNIVVQNGTKTAGKAGKVVDKIKELGVVNVTGGNADNTDYVESKVYFKNEEIKKISIDKILSVVLVVGANILIDNTMENDVKLILGIN